MIKLIRRQSPGRIIALGFACVILIGSLLLMLPISVRDGVNLRYIDALYTSTSAVCVTGLIAVDAGDTFTPVGQFFLAMLIQIGGLGVTSVGAGVILAIGRIVGETAALIYTSGTVAGVPETLMGSGRSLAVHMYALLSNGLYTEQAYATAVVLLVMVVGINALSAWLAKKVSAKQR